MKCFGLYFLIVLFMVLTMGQSNAQENNLPKTGDVKDEIVKPMPHHIIDAPLRCKPNQKPDRYGKCRDIY